MEDSLETADPSPDWMHRVEDCSPSSLQKLIDLLERSSAPEHWLYREAELDDLWRHAEMELQRVRTDSPSKTALIQAYESLHATAFKAHNLASAGQVREAASMLEQASSRLASAEQASE